MADVIFVKHENGQIEGIKGEDGIHSFVLQELRKYEGLEAAKNVWEKIGKVLVADDRLRVRDMIMTRFFLCPSPEYDFVKMDSLSDIRFAVTVREVANYMSYMLFPLASEFNGLGESDNELGFGGGFLRTLRHVPQGTKSYFLHDWSI